ncbi:MAG: AAA family ATPase [Gemmatimonadales bacterium]
MRQAEPLKALKPPLADPPILKHLDIPVISVAILGARQVGKTTLARQIAATQKRVTARFDLENSRDLARLEDPMLALQDLRGLEVWELTPTVCQMAEHPCLPT